MPTTGAMPLFALDAVALDLETTGLDPSQALIIEIGAVPVSRATVRSERAYSRLVDPGTPIPPRSTEIHGITDAMVRGAGPLAEAWVELDGVLQGRVLIGHSTGYDLAVLAAEARRRHLPWTRPRALCVRLLSLIVAPALASHSLEALASWLGLEARDRHRALGDAETAARIFVALVPLLQSKGIRTLAEAERACASLGVEMERHRGAGWEPPAAEPRDTPLGSVDTHAYRHKVGDIMARRVVVVAPETTLGEAMAAMVDRSISSVFVAPDAAAGLDVSAYAIVTERDAMRRIAAFGAAALTEPVRSIGSSPVHTIREQAFLYRAVGRMSRIGTRHLGVRSEAGTLVGVVSARDLLKLRAGPAIALADSIEAAPTAEDLATRLVDAAGGGPVAGRGRSRRRYRQPDRQRGDPLDDPAGGGARDRGHGGRRPGSATVPVRGAGAGIRRAGRKPAGAGPGQRDRLRDPARRTASRIAGSPPWPSA